MWDGFKNFLIVAVVSMFIWLVADRNVREDHQFQVPVRLSTRNPDRYAAIADPPFMVVLDVSMSGRRRQLQAFSELLGSKEYLEALIDESKDPRPGSQVISTAADLLPRIKELADSGLFVRSVSPKEVSVVIDNHEVVRNVAVEPDYGDLKVVAEVSPSRISVRLPAFAAAKLKTEPAYRPDAEQRIRDARRPDNTFEITIPATFEFEHLDPASPIQVSPSAEITITGRIEALTETRRKGPIQITWSIPDEVQRDYVIAPKPDQSLRRDIEVTGPKGQVEQLPLSRIRGFVDVMAADEPGVEVTRAVRFVLPEGFSLASDASAHEIAFTLIPRPAAPPAGPSGG